MEKETNPRVREISKEMLEGCIEVLSKELGKKQGDERDEFIKRISSAYTYYQIAYRNLTGKTYTPKGI